MIGREGGSTVGLVDQEPKETMIEMASVLFRDLYQIPNRNLVVLFGSLFRVWPS